MISRDILCGEADKFYNCVTCGSPCGTEGHYIEELFQYKDKTYKIDKFAEMKHPTTREWVDCVVYTQKENGETYVREREEFYKLFK